MREADIWKADEHRSSGREYDSLTGLYSPMAAYDAIDRALLRNTGGILLLIDVVDFKSINAVYGHLKGDQVLQEIAGIIDYFFFRKDIIGRMSKDQFIVFMTGAYTKEMICDKAASLKARIAQIQKLLQLEHPLLIRIGVDFTKEEDTFLSLWKRVMTAAAYEKSSKTGELHFYDEAMAQQAQPVVNKREDLEMAIDLHYINTQLKERDMTEGAYCQDYHNFLSIYRFLERVLVRTDLRVQLILLTLTDCSGTFVDLNQREELMEKVRDSICVSLRLSDIYTQYSSCQFLVMALNAEEENLDTITARIEQTFREHISERNDVILTAGCYPLEPVIHIVQEQ